MVRIAPARCGITRRNRLNSKQQEAEHPWVSRLLPSLASPNFTGNRKLAGYEAALRQRSRLFELQPPAANELGRNSW